MSLIKIETLTITDAAIKGIKGNNKLIAHLMLAFDRSQNTIENWMAAKDVRLTTPTAVQIIARELKLTESEIIQRVTTKI